MSDPINIDDLLERFRHWLDSGSRRGSDAAEPAKTGLATGESRQFGLIDLVAEFTALRQELKLQTKSTRGLQEQTESLLPPLQQAIEHFRSVAPREEQAAWTAGKPLAEGLATLDEALERARGELEKARERSSTSRSSELEGDLEQLFKGQSWFRRRRFRSYHEQVVEVVDARRKGSTRRWFESLVEGFGLMQNRLRRVMQAESIERIECLGGPSIPSG